MILKCQESINMQMSRWRRKNVRSHTWPNTYFKNKWSKRSKMKSSWWCSVWCFLLCFSVHLCSSWAVATFRILLSGTMQRWQEYKRSKILYLLVSCRKFVKQFLWNFFILPIHLSVHCPLGRDKKQSSHFWFYQNAYFAVSI